MFTSNSDRSVLPLPSPAHRVPIPAEHRDGTSGFEPFRPLQPPPGAPNVLLVLIDDMGFGAPSAFGGPIRMPAADRLAAGGLRFTRFHTTALCSPTRASLLSGRNHHSVGMGRTPEIATNAPGYNSMRPNSAATIAQILSLNGYSTAAFGKWHQTPSWEITPAGPFDRWPTGEGFDRFYGFIGADANHYYPCLYDGTTPVDVPGRPEDGYHLSEDLVDRAIAWVAEQQAAAPDRPFFCYLPFGACHAPLHVRKEWVEPYRHRFDHGWDRERQITLQRQRELGIVPQGAELSPWPAEAPRWKDQSPEDRELSCRLMELYAGFATHTDVQVDRLVTALERHGLLDNTLVLYLLGDNGASAEGGLNGTRNEIAYLNGFSDSAEELRAEVELLGGPETFPHYPAGWALAMDTPYQWAKQVASHYGGTRNGLIVHWPAGIAARGELRHQWHHCIDVAPTILDAAGLPEPRSVNGVDQRRMDGVSMRYAFDNAAAADRHGTQYFEIFGNRGIYHEGWVACTKHRIPWKSHSTDPIPDFDDDRWELYDTASDWTQARDIAGERPDKLAELQRLFLIEAARYQVLPLDGRIRELLLPEVAGRHTVSSGRSHVTYPGSTRHLPEDVVINVRNRSHRIVAMVDVDSPATGVIAAQGGSFGGWAVYLQNGVLMYCNNVVGWYHQYVRSEHVVPVGAHELGFELRYDDGEGFGLGGLVALYCDGVMVGEGRVERTTPFKFSNSDRFSVGADVGTPVSRDYPAIDNHFCGTVHSVMIATASDALEEPVDEWVSRTLRTH